jgi:hypothetical protein
MEKKYNKLSALVNNDFTVEKVWGYEFKAWDNVAKTMLTSKTWVKDHRKMYQIETDQGKLDISAGQLGNMLEGVSKDGKADLNGKTFHVKSNGKSGIDIRYYINPVFDKPVVDDDDDEPINLDDIPY